MDIKESIRHIVEDIIPDKQTFIVDILVSGHKGTRKVLVLLDADQGLDIDICSSVSRELSARLDESDLLEGSYVLEVSSPGLDHPLIFTRQYIKNIGRMLNITLNDNMTIKGELLEVTEDGIKINVEIREKKMKPRLEAMDIRFSEIKKTNVLVSF
ncbi:MAG: ribosome maturation factor RimP [Cyclobacteriaceae bacterium]|nr:ribosome maturation factor RimP [Cyclobacteriaceae bacterium]